MWLNSIESSRTVGKLQKVSHVCNRNDRRRWNVKKKKKRWNVFLHPLNQALWCSLACIACGRNDGETVLSLNFVSPCTFPHFLLESCLYQVNKSRLRWVAQSCPTLCDPIDCSPPGTSVHGDSPGKNTGVSCHALLHSTYSSVYICSSQPPIYPSPHFPLW